MTIANLITILRFLLVPGVVYACWRAAWTGPSPASSSPGVSDGVDGFIARQFNQRSELGAYLDPMADKLLLVSVFVVLGFMGSCRSGWSRCRHPRRADRLRGAAVDRDGQAGRDEAAVRLQGKHRRADRACRIVVLAELAFETDFIWVDRRARLSERPLDRGFRGGLSRSLVEAHERLWRRRNRRRMMTTAEAAARGAFPPADPFLADRRDPARAVPLYVQRRSCCPSWPAWCWPISSIPSPTGCSGCGLSRTMATDPHPDRLPRRAGPRADHRHPGPGDAARRFHRQAAGISRASCRRWSPASTRNGWSSGSASTPPTCARG